MNLSDIPTYGLAPEAKQDFLLRELNRLGEHHYQHCKPYRRLLDAMHGGWRAAPDLTSLPYLPVRLFKHQELLSVDRSEVVKTMTSSGTSGQQVSRIFLDKQTAALQIKVLSGIVGSVLGRHRLPMLVMDAPSTMANRLQFSARTAGILGFSMFGRDLSFALNDDLSLNRDGVDAFLHKYAGQPVMLFGFTSFIWQHVVLQLEASGGRLALDHGILLHGGGWKKLAAQAVSAEEFKQRLQAVTGIRRVHNYYGMVEQTGSIYMECEAGHLHSSSFSEILVRDPVSFQPLPPGQVGLIQLLSVLPHSYPGHVLLSEDLGEILPLDRCPCGREGSVVRIHGRVPQAEVRGCSDAYAS